MSDWKYVKNNVTERDINQFGKETGVSFDKELIDFILMHNNGRPVNNEIEIADEREATLIFDKLLSFNENDIENVFSTYSTLKGQVSDNLVPIGLDPSGNYFCLDVENDNQIVFWNHELNSVRPLGMSFFQLIEALH